MKSKFKTKKGLSNAVDKIVHKAGVKLIKEGIEIDYHCMKFDGCYEDQNQSTLLDLSWYLIQVDFHNLETGKSGEVTCRAYYGADSLIEKIRNDR